MTEQSESAARVITVALNELVRIAEEGDLPMLAYMLDMARIEARAQGGDATSPPRSMVPITHN